MSWYDAMDKYGSDKPDVRFDMTIHELTSLAKGHGFSVFDSVDYIGGIAVKAPLNTPESSWTSLRSG